MTLCDDFLPAIVAEILEAGSDQLVDVGLRERTDNDVLKPAIVSSKDCTR